MGVEYTVFASILPMKELFVGRQVRDQKDVVFTGKGASELHVNKMGV